MLVNGRQESEAESLRRHNRVRTEETIRAIRRATYYPVAVASVSLPAVVLLLYFFIPAFFEAVR